MIEAARKPFGVESVREMLTLIGRELKTPITVVLVGGGAMSFKGDKEATKDVDMVVLDKTDFDIIIQTTSLLGFKDCSVDFPDYRDISATVLIDEQGFHIALFLETIAKKFRVHSGVLDRAQKSGEFDMLKVLLLSDEDLFLSKSVTERDMDLDDMGVLFRKGLEVDIIIKESEIQNQYSDLIWEAYLAQKLIELQDHAQITVEWLDIVEKIAVKKDGGKHIQIGGPVGRYNSMDDPLPCGPD